MSLSLSIGKEELHIVASPAILEAIVERYGSFVTSAPTVNSRRAPIIIEIMSRPNQFRPGYERPVEALVSESAPQEIAINGGVRGRYTIASRRGVIENVSGVGAVDAFIRIVLSVALPLGGALLVHGAALSNGRDPVIALCGNSGSGKSTAVTALGGFCDESVVLRPTKNDVELYSTPYWAGRPYRSRCGTVVFLERGGKPGFIRLGGTTAVRNLARHVVRCVAIEEIDRAILDLVCSISARVAVNLVSCPEGNEFIPFLERQLQLAEAA